MSILRIATVEYTLREDGVRIIHEVLQELAVLGAEIFTGLLQAINLIKLILLLGKGLTNNLTRLLIGFVTNALCIIFGISNELIRRSLSNEKHLGDLMLGSCHGCICLICRRFL